MKTLTDDSILTIENVLNTPYSDELRIWRNMPEVRCNMLDDTEISEQRHRAYIDSLKQREDRRVFVVEDRGEPLIVLNLMIDDDRGLVNLGWHRARYGDIAPLYSVYAFFTAYDWLFETRPYHCQRDVVLDSNRGVWTFVQGCGFELGDPRPEMLDSGKTVFVRDTFCTRELWLNGSARMRRMYERVLSKAASAQVGILW